MTLLSSYRSRWLTFALFSFSTCIHAQFITAEDIQATETAKNARYIILGAGAFEPNSIPLIQEITNGSVTGKPIRTIAVQGGAAQAYLLNALHEETALTRGLISSNVFRSLESEFRSCLSMRLGSEIRFVGYEYEDHPDYAIAAIELMLTKADHPGAASCLSYIRDRKGKFLSTFNIFNTSQQICDSLFKRVRQEELLDPATMAELQRIQVSYMQYFEHRDAYKLPTWADRLALYQKNLYLNLERIVAEQPEGPILVLCNRSEMNRTFTHQRTKYDSFMSWFLANPALAAQTLCLAVVYDEGWESKTRRKLGFTGKNKRMLQHAGTRLWRKNDVISGSHVHYYTFDRYTNQIFNKLHRNDAFPGCE